MIGAVSEPLQKRQYLQAAWNCPGLAARLACQLELFGQKPGSGWRFFTADRGTLAALALRGGAAFGCGDFCGEELGFLLRCRSGRQISQGRRQAHTRGLGVRACHSGLGHTSA